MKVCGFTIIRNAIKFDYPAVEAITSILPFCDEMIVLVGNSEDGTRQMIENIGSSKIKIYDSIWDDTLREGGRVLAAETNKAFDLVPADADWCFYIQADEVVHEQYHPAIKAAMQRWLHTPKVEGLLFKYTHFYGSYDYVGDSSRWYRNEIRIVRNDKSIRSYKDAQGFRKNNSKLCVKPIVAEVYHYGWVKPPELQQLKQKHFHKMWHDDQWVEQNVPKVQAFDYSQVDSLLHFNGTHPKVMQARINSKNWQFEFDPTIKKLSLKYKLLYWLEKNFGYKPGEYRNYKTI